jgi:SRSO17 transposase
MNADSATKMRCFLPIPVMNKTPGQEDHRMITIGRMPRVVNRFFGPARAHFSKPAWPHFWRLVTAMAMATEHTIERLNALLREGTHRTNDGEFLWRSDFDEAAVLQGMALRQLNRVWRPGEPIYFILDDTQTLKRAKKMEAVGKLYHHATGKYGTGHTILKACLYCRGVTIPWGSWLYVKKSDAPKLGVPFATLTKLAAKAIEQIPLPPWMPVTILFDAYYLCAKVTKAVENKGWHYIGVAKSNRRLRAEGGPRGGHVLRSYGANVLRRSGKDRKITGLRRTSSYRVAERIGTMKKLGRVKVVFSRRRGDGKVVSLVTNDLKRSGKRVVGDYLRRWSIEMLIKDEKQHLGLGDYRVLRFRAVARHLCLVDCAYACLTHLGIEARRAQGQTKNEKMLRLEPISKLKKAMHQIVWQESIKNIVKYSHEKPVIRRLEKLLAA